MTENQEKELFNKIATLVTGVQAIQSDVQEIKETQNEHSRILNEHSRILKRLDAKTGSIAETVMKNDNRLTVVENDVADLRTRIQ